MLKRESLLGLRLRSSVRAHTICMSGVKYRHRY